MTVTKAQLTELANNLISGGNKLGVDLTADGWSFEWGNMKALGDCYYGRKILRLSEKYLGARTLEEYTNTITHEIAHAIAGYEAHHGPEWKRIHRALGGTAETRSSVSNIDAVEYKYYVVFTNKDGEIEILHRMDRLTHKWKNENVHALYLPSRKAETLGKLKTVTAREYKRIIAQQEAEKAQAKADNRVTITGKKRISKDGYTHTKRGGVYYVCGDTAFTSMKAAGDALGLHKNAIGNRCNPRFAPRTFAQYPNWFIVDKADVANQSQQVQSIINNMK